MNITIISLPNGQQVMGKIIEEDDDSITLDAPITIGMTNPITTETAVMTSRYMPLAKNWIVTFHKINIVGFSFVEDTLIDHYESMIKHYRSRPYNYSSDRVESEPENISSQEEQEDLIPNNKTYH